MTWQGELTLAAERGLLHFQEFSEPVDILLVAGNQPDDNTEINNSTHQDSSPRIGCEAFTGSLLVLPDVLEWENYMAVDSKKDRKEEHGSLEIT